MTTATAPTKTEVRNAIRDMKKALRAAEAEVSNGNMEKAAQFLHYLVAPGAARTARDIADALGIDI